MTIWTYSYIHCRVWDLYDLLRDITVTRRLVTGRDLCDVCSLNIMIALITHIHINIISWPNRIYSSSSSSSK